MAARSHPPQAELSEQERASCDREPATRKACEARAKRIRSHVPSWSSRQHDVSDRLLALIEAIQHDLFEKHLWPQERLLRQATAPKLLGASRAG